MENGIFVGFAHSLTGMNLLFALLGSILGTLVGVLPGLGPASTIAILFPLVFYFPPEATLIAMAAVFYGAMYGGSTTSILMNVPGEAASVPTAIEGYQMARQGKAGPALAISAIGSFLAGTMGVIALNFLAPMLATLAVKFGAIERLCLFIFALTAAFSLAGPSLTRGFISVLLGLMLGCTGPDPQTGVMRLSFGQVWLLQGIQVVPVLIGLFGLTEVLSSLDMTTVAPGKIGRLMPNGQELRDGLWACLRGGLVGGVLGLIPGMTAAATSFIAYDLEKKISRNPGKFGTGVIEGVASVEAANNATAQMGFIPLMALGIPTSPTLVILLAAFVSYGVFPGPLLFTEHSALAYTVIASMYIGNVMLLILNLPLVGLWARVSLVPYKILAPIILGVCIVGAYSINNAMLDVWTCIVFGIVGLVMRKLEWPVAPLVLGQIIGPMLETDLRRSIALTSGRLLEGIIGSPIGISLLILAAVMLFAPYIIKRVTGMELVEDQ